ncbi:hypothetical protein TOPH_06751 [Tolypocladium ophioglossoides CBS 100239]|uniref:Uncharacterized protein n=1 Tax=Tolypocladium ophioglossoides (strain CBS 100239) TaxID=1163406 RepID=A0A0L0N3K7_TOLOC|nr:hypothetical protein TOPH_06751 [Tolypocladium ophioglossoides CBS 100239]
MSIVRATRFGIFQGQTPMALDETLRALYDRAIADPSSLSDEERRRIAHRPPPEEEDALCRDACGLSMSELLTKAVQNGDSLSYQEARLVTAGVLLKQAGSLFGERMKLSETDRYLSLEAEEAVKTEEMVAAQKNAWAVEFRWHAAERAARETLNNQDYRNIKFAMHVLWQEHVLSLTETTVCGLVLFFPKMPEWPSFKEQIETSVRHGLNGIISLRKDAAIAKFTLHWVEDNDPSALRNRFATTRDGNQFPAGLRLDSFLYVDEEALRSYDAPKPFVWLWEPQDSAEPLKVHIKHIAPVLFARLTQRDLSTEKARRWPFLRTSELEMLHYEASRSLTTLGERDDIWPPHPRTL